MDTRKRAGATAVLLAGLVTALAGCRIDVTPQPGDPSVVVTPPPVGTPAVTFDGNAGLDKPFDVVAPDDADLATEVESGVYTTAGAIGTADESTCKFVQTRVVKVDGDVRAEVAVSDPSLDKPQPVAEPAPAVVTDDPATPERDLKVTLKVGDQIAAVGCEDFVKVDDLPEGDG